MYTKMVADRYFLGNQSIIAFQGVTMTNSFAVDTTTLKLAAKVVEA
jgi:hypothetical protein